jgi:hypothetical protein
MEVVNVITSVDDFTPNELEIWYSGKDEFLVQVESPSGMRSTPVALGTRGEVLDLGGHVVGRLYHRESDPNNSDHHIDLFLDPSAPPGRWRVFLQAVAVRDGRFHAWLERDEFCADCQAHFIESDIDRRCTTGTLANGHLPLVVGAYNTRGPFVGDVAVFSSAGPTRDGRPKPDLVAPGVGILAARSAPRGSRRSTGMLTRKSGTSFAAPHVTGAVALCLQGAPWLEGSQIRELLLRCARPASSDGRSWSRLGRGYLDVAKVAAAVDAVRATRVQRPTLASSATKTDSKYRSKESGMYVELDHAISASIGSDRLFRELVYRPKGRPTAAIREAFFVLAHPGEALRARPEAGDFLVRVALGESGLGRIAVLSDERLRTPAALDRAGIGREHNGPGLYSLVTDVAPVTSLSGECARLILDRAGRLPAGQLLLRPRDTGLGGPHGKWATSEEETPITPRDFETDEPLWEAEDEEDEEESDEEIEAGEVELSLAYGTSLEDAETARPEIVLVAGANYPKFKQAGKVWKRVRRLSPGPWRQYCLRVAEDRLTRDPTLKVTLFDLLLGAREDVTLHKGKAVATLERSFVTPIDGDYWNVVGIDLSHPTQAQALAATLQPANKSSLSAKAQVNYFEGANAFSKGKPFNFLSFFLNASAPASAALSITDVYSYIEGFASSGKTGALRELHFFSHAFNISRGQFSGGPILLNSLDNPLRTDRHPLDKDARAGKDFVKPTMDPAVFAQAFSAGALSFVWGCNFQRGFIRQFVHQVAKNREALARGQSMKITHDSDWGDEGEFRTRLGLAASSSVRSVSVDLSKIEQVLRDTNQTTYMKQLAIASGRPVVGGPPGTYADTDSSASPLELQHIPMTSDPFRDTDVSFERVLIFFRDHLNFRFDKSFGDHKGLGRGYMLYDP